LNNKGLALMGLDNYSEAIVYFDRTLRINPNCEWTLENKELAEEELKKPELILLIIGVTLLIIGVFILILIKISKPKIETKN
jgi:tetratricopeptide (TPR) repeat protein